MYITCSICGHRYKAKRTDKGEILPRKHYQYIPNTNNMGITVLPGKKIICPGCSIPHDLNYYIGS